MKNRKLIIIAFVLVSAMVVGIGYAALTTEVNVTGSLGFGNVSSQFDTDIQLTGSPEIAMYNVNDTEVTGLTTDKLSATFDGADPDEGAITAKAFTAVGQYVVAKYEIINRGSTNLAAKLDYTVSSTTTDVGYTRSEFYFTENSTDALETKAVVGEDAYTLEPGETCWITIKIFCDLVPDDDTELSKTGTIVWKVNAESTDPTAP